MSDKPSDAWLNSYLQRMAAREHECSPIFCPKTILLEFLNNKATQCLVFSDIGD